jgi:cation-transporting ATPase 13A1
MMYSVFTLFLLFVTACTIVIQRMRTMLTLRQMKINASFVTVFRKGTWSKVSSEDLVPPLHSINKVPGDIMIL